MRMKTTLGALALTVMLTSMLQGQAAAANASSEPTATQTAPIVAADDPKVVRRVHSWWRMRTW